MRTRILAALALACALAAPAAAKPTSEDAKAFLNRARRHLVLGPHAGGALTFAPSPGTFSGGGSFGLGIYLFKDPLLDIGGIKDRLMERLKARKAEILEEVKTLPEGDREAKRDALLAEIEAEIRREINTYESMPAPSKVFILEGVILDGQWQVRLSTGLFGLSKVAIGPTLAVAHCDAGTTLLVGPELAVHYLIGKGLRTPTAQLFLRYDFATFNREVFADTATLGLRVSLDVL